VEPDAAASVQTADRTASWAGTLVGNQGILGSGECNLGNFARGTDGGTCGPAYANAEAIWVQAFLGCPVPGDGGAVTYGLIPPCQSTHTFTTADLALLNTQFMLALETTAAGGDLSQTNSTTTAQPLTSAQISAVTAKLQALSDAVGALSSSRYTLSTCPMDAGGGG